MATPRVARSPRRSAVTVVLLLSAIAVLALYAALAAWAHPSADDFCYAAKARGLSLWAWSRGEYHAWNGRYASNLLMWRNPLSWGTDFLPGYRLVPVLLLLLSFAAYWAVVRAITQDRLGRGGELLGALVLLTLFLGGMPALGEGLYWYTGAVTYQLANILLALLVTSYVHTLRAARAGIGRNALNTVLALAIGGMSEQHLVLLCAGGIFICFRAAPGRRGVALLLCGAAFLSAAVVLSAPGNAVRSGYFEGAHRLLFSGGMTAVQSVRFLATWLFSPALLATSVLYVALHPFMREHVPAFRTLPSPALFAAAGLAVVALCIFPAYWSMGMLAQHRTLNVAYWCVLPLWALGLSALSERLRSPVQLAPASRLALAVVMGVGLFATGNGRAALNDLLQGRAQHYDRHLTERYASFRHAQGMLVLDPLPDPPQALAPFEERRPDQHWMSECEARYFGVRDDQVRMRGIAP